MRGRCGSYYVTSCEDLGDQVDRYCDDILCEKYVVTLHVLVSGFPSSMNGLQMVVQWAG